jgi:hypothetical protein
MLSVLLVGALCATGVAAAATAPAPAAPTPISTATPAAVAAQQLKALLALGGGAPAATGAAVPASTAAAAAAAQQLKALLALGAAGAAAAAVAAPAAPAPPALPAAPAVQQLRALLALASALDRRRASLAPRWTAEAGANGRFCAFPGVTCDTEGQVTRISLFSQPLAGTLPSGAVLAALPRLAVLDLSQPLQRRRQGAGLRGPLPADWRKLTALKQLDLRCALPALRPP